MTIDHARDAWRKVGVSLPEREIARALRSLTSREVLRSLTSREGLAGTQAYSFNVDLQRLWLEKHRHLDWVKDELAETVQQWNRSAEPWPADAIPGQTSGPVPASAEGATNGREPEESIRGGKAASHPPWPLPRYRSRRNSPGQLPGGCGSRSRVPLLQFDAGRNFCAKPRPAIARRPNPE